MIRLDKKFIIITQTPINVIIKYFNLPLLCSNNTNLTVNHRENPNNIIPI